MDGEGDQHQHQHQVTHHEHHRCQHECPQHAASDDDDDDLRVTIGGEEGVISEGTVVLRMPPHHRHHHREEDEDKGEDGTGTLHHGTDEGDVEEAPHTTGGGDADGGGEGGAEDDVRAGSRRQRRRWRLRVWCGRRRARKRQRQKQRMEEEEGRRWWKSVFLYYYLRSLFPTPKEFDYRWEWNPRTYLLKLLALEETGKNRSKHKQNYPYPLIVILYCWVGSFVGIAVVAIITQYGFSHLDKPLLIGSFGATSVLIYGAQQSPLAQPKNVLGGHGIAALVGVTCYQIMGSEWYSCALAVSLAIAFMLLTTTPHPPAGATALIAVTGGDTIFDAGYWYVLTTLLGLTIMLSVALVWNNMPRAPHMRYPRYWI